MTVGEVITDDEDKFEFKRDAEEGGVTYTLEPLTPENHKEFVEPHLIEPEDTEKSE